MSGIDEVLSEVDNVNRIVTNSEHIREELKIPADISDDKIAECLLNAFWNLTYYIDPELADALTYLEERKIEE